MHLVAGHAPDRAHEGQQLVERGGEFGLGDGPAPFHVDGQPSLEDRLRALGHIVAVHVEFLQQLGLHRGHCHVDGHLELRERRVHQCRGLVQLGREIVEVARHSAHLEVRAQRSHVTLVLCLLVAPRAHPAEPRPADFLRRVAGVAQLAQQQLEYLHVRLRRVRLERWQPLVHELLHLALKLCSRHAAGRALRCVSGGRTEAGGQAAMRKGVCARSDTREAIERRPSPGRPGRPGGTSASFNSGGCALGAAVEIEGEN